MFKSKGVRKMYPSTIGEKYFIMSHIAYFKAAENYIYI